MAYASEIIARTEQYFFPIKHAKKVLGTHMRYRYYLDAADFHKKLEGIRVELLEEKNDVSKS